MSKVFILLSSTIWQFFISWNLFFGILIYRIIFEQNTVLNVDIRSTTPALGTIGSILALTTSVSFAFMIFAITRVSNRKHDLFYRLKSFLFDFDNFLEKTSNQKHVSNKAQELSWELKFLTISDFPIMNWNDKTRDLLNLLESEEDPLEDPNFNNKVLGYLGFIENLISEIGVACISQIVALKHFEVVYKVLALIGLLLLALVSNYLNFGAMPAKVLSVSPVFFASFSSLILLELGWLLHREKMNMLDFVEWNSDRSNKMN
ncbi:hypothetical protein C7271_13980 [filamentous cyanobacterium CCP5]|nr:hypothetical protein C7271_13980 [filamentous cyanobacterium CCP5]